MDAGLLSFEEKGPNTESNLLPNHGDTLMPVSHSQTLAFQLRTSAPQNLSRASRRCCPRIRKLPKYGHDKRLPCQRKLESSLSLASRGSRDQLACEEGSLGPKQNDIPGGGAHERSFLKEKSWFLTQFAFWRKGNHSELDFEKSRPPELSCFQRWGWQPQEGERMLGHLDLHDLCRNLNDLSCFWGWLGDTVIKVIFRGLEPTTKLREVVFMRHQVLCKKKGKNISQNNWHKIDLLDQGEKKNHSPLKYLMGLGSKTKATKSL
ncbi:hypothetical protein CR513_36028, partial [Mucuna pruriens]